jgi:acyl-homoserine lactone acylase PvdQ
MTKFDAGILLGVSGGPDTQVSFYETVHGPVIGYARTTNGRRVAISQKRSTRGRELVSAAAFMALDENRVHSARDFVQTMNGVEFSFNWFYADDRSIAYFSSGRLPVRPANVDPRLPADGTGGEEWRGFLTQAQHPQAIDPASGAIVNWNNKQARGFGAADDNWDYGSVHRADLLAAGVAGKSKLTLPDVVGVMNNAATQDLRAIRVLPVVEALLKTGAPSARAEVALSLLESWRAAGAPRLDLNGDGKIDDPGAAIMDAFWPRLAEALFQRVLGSALTDQLKQLTPVDDVPSPSGSSFLNGWYGFVDKDLRALLGQPVTGAFKTRFCGAGDLAKCRDDVWAALDGTGSALAAAQGPTPAAWRGDANAEKIKFSPGILSTRMRWTNRSTFQQVVSFSRHRPR